MRVGIVGAGRRAQHIYGPVVRAMPELTLAGICSRSGNGARRFAADYGCGFYPDLDAMIAKGVVHLLIVCVDWLSNAETYRQVAQCDIPALLETPLAAGYAEALDVARALDGRSVPTEIAEQYPRRPVEVLKRQMIDRGLFGEVFYAFNDGVGHEYHGISLIRSYLGYERRLRRVFALQRDVPCFPHVSHREIFFPGERIQHALLEFDSGGLAAHHWSWLAYMSPVRCRRIAGFHATRGAAYGDEILLLEDPESPVTPVHIERRTRVVDGVEVLHDAVASCRDRVVARWSNPAPGMILNEDQIVAAGILRSLVDQVRGEAGPAYTPGRALEDLEIVNAINEALALSGQPPTGL